LELLLRWRPGVKSLLDVGSGYGSFVLVARAAGIDAHGVELAPYEVRFARERLAAERPSDDAEDVYRDGDAHTLPFPDATFEAVTFWNVLEHVPDASRAIAEAARVLRPGGVLALIAPNYAALRREAHYGLWWPPLMPKRLGARYLRRRGRDPRFWLEDIHPCTQLGIVRALRDAGLELRHPRAERLADPARMTSPKLRAVARVLNTTRLLKPAQALAGAGDVNPLKPMIFQYAEKP
jgi:SAM-dependent methyltransferase